MGGRSLFARLGHVQPRKWTHPGGLVNLPFVRSGICETLPRMAISVVMVQLFLLA